MRNDRHSGELYRSGDKEAFAEQARCAELRYEFNSTRPSELEKRANLLKEMFAEIGEGCFIEPPLNANWAGKNVHFGSNIYANFNLTLVDDTHIYVGSNTMFGPNVILSTAAHPVQPELRKAGYQYNLPIVIGENCWLGAGVIVLPGVKIGKNSVIGAGSVVTRDIPENVVAMGTPCRVVREIGEHDKEFYYRDKRIDPAILIVK